MNQFKGFIGSTKEAKRANERRIYKSPLSDFTLIPKLLHIHTLSLNYNYYAGTGPLLHLVFFTNRMLSTVTQMSIAYQIVGIESVGFKFTNRIGPGSNFFHYTQQQVYLW